MSLADSTVTLVTSQGEQVQMAWTALADKALDMVGAVGTSLADAVQKLAPEAWEILIRQVYADAVGDIIYSVGALLIGIVFYKVLGKMWKVPDPNDYQYTSDYENARAFRAAFTKVIPTIYMIAFGIISLYNIGWAVKAFLNPKYYALQYLFELAGKTF